MGKDTHAVSGPAQRTALEVLAANSVETIIQRDDGVTPTPVISWLILMYNRDRKAHLADGIVITPSHNPPEDGGFKYNPPHGGPADTQVTGWIQDHANTLLAEELELHQRHRPGRVLGQRLVDAEADLLAGNELPALEVVFQDRAGERGHRPQA